MKKVVYFGQDGQVVEKVEEAGFKIKQIKNYDQCNSYISEIGNVFDLALTGGIGKNWMELRKEIYPDLILSEVKMTRSKGGNEIIPCGPANIINIQKGLQFPPTAFLLVEEYEYDEGLREYCKSHSINVLLKGSGLIEEIREGIEKEVGG